MPQGRGQVAARRAYVPAVAVADRSADVSAGDHVLRAMAEGRLGGEEFAVALCYTAIPDAFQIAERKCRGVGAEPFTIDGDKLHV
jgi:GGDEF domain-containing protein